MTVIAHLRASAFLGAPERQILGLALSLPGRYRSAFLSFDEGGGSRAFLEEALGRGFDAHVLESDTPRLLAAAGELGGLLRRMGADVLCCHGYKADIVGRLVAKRLGIPAVAVAHGWTGESLKVRVYETLDRICMRGMDRIVCVSEGQAAKVRRAGVPADRVVVIHNAIQAERFENADSSGRQVLLNLFTRPPRLIVGAAGRLSPEKGFKDLVEAARIVSSDDPSVGYVLFGDGPLRKSLSDQIEVAGLGGNFILAGFRTDLDRILPHLDLLVLPSYTEGLPNVVLEASAAAVPVVATAVGGTPEAVEDGLSGFLVPPGDPPALAGRILDALTDEPSRRRMGQHGHRSVLERFTFGSQSVRYQALFEELAERGRGAGAEDPERGVGRSKYRREVGRE